jgi:hypothetical protein
MSCLVDDKCFNIVKGGNVGLAGIALTRVARWFAFKSKIPTCEKKFGASDWKMLKYFMAI